MAHMTLQVGPQTEEDLAVLKSFFGTKSGGAAIRSALMLAQILARTSKDGVIRILDQRSGTDMNIRIAR